MTDTTETTFINLHDYAAFADQHLSPMAYGYYASGAGDEITLRENRAAYERLTLMPRVLAGVDNRSSQTSVLGQSLAAPLIIAPMAFMRLAHADGEMAVARATAARGLLMTLSTMSTYSIEDVATTDISRWFQLYCYKDRGVTADLVQRAKAAGYTALVVTVDTPILGKREADIRNSFHLPDGIHAANFAGRMAQVEGATGQSALMTYLQDLWNIGLSWDDIDWLASLTDLPVVLKGVLRADDAQIALEHGVQGIVVSNHGGRQLDTSPATIDALPDIAAAVGDQMDLLLDGGIRRGTDIIKALALGAKAVMVGRPVLWGLAHSGETGVGHVLDILLEEFDHALALCGCTMPAAITPDLVRRP